MHDLMKTYDSLIFITDEEPSSQAWICNWLIIL